MRSKKFMSEITIKDIAEIVGVSYATVSRTLNNRRGVSPATRELIFKTAEKLGYKPNLHARSLKTNQTHVIALIVPDIANPFFSDIALSVSETAFEKGYNTILCSTNWDPEIETAQLKMVQEQRVDGIIFKPSDRSCERYLDISTQKVMIANQHCAETSYVEVDNFTGGQLAARHLLQCGYQNPAFIGGARESFSNADRLASFQQVLAENGMKLTEKRISYGPFSIENGYSSAKEQLSMNEKSRPDCFFCGNDLIALGAYQYLLEREIKVPQQFGLIGFDDIYLSSLPQIQLTTLSQPRKKMGQLATELLINQIEKNHVGQHSHILLQPELIIRKSTRLQQ